MAKLVTDTFSLLQTRKSKVKEKLSDLPRVTQIESSNPFCLISDGVQTSVL